jgi:hypothetical protein
MLRRIALPLLALIAALPAAASAETPALVELQFGGDKLQGKIVARNDDRLWLVGQDGRMRSVKSGDAGKLRQVSARFSGWTVSVLRDALRREFGKEFAVAGTRHYAVCAHGDQKARAYAETFEELFRTFQMYFSVRGFKINEPEFPLVAVVFPDYESFARYARAEKVEVSRTLRGYYQPASNRVALYESRDGLLQSQLNPVRRVPQRQLSLNLEPGELSLPPDGVERGGRLGAQSRPHSSFLADHAAWGAVEGSLKDTMIHEATHQAAFNTGLHSRIGESPRWVVEGLATVFEAPGIRNSGGGPAVRNRINHERFLWFGNYSNTRRTAKSLEAFLSNDELFRSAVLDAYSEAWAFSFFLIETRPRPYGDYLRAIAARDPLRAYPAAERLADFKKAVSRDLPLLEAEFLRFMAAIK